MPIPAEVPPPCSAARPLPRWVRGLLLGFASLCMVLAVIGVILPGMPATVFLLMAAWAAARSSPWLHAWLLNHRLFGPMLRDWDDGHSVSRRAKWSAAATMAVGAVVLMWTAPRPWIAASCIGCMAVVLTWLWRRPEPRG